MFKLELQSQQLQNKTITKKLLLEKDETALNSTKSTPLPLPIITFEEEYLQVWSKLITAKQNISAAAVILSSSPKKKSLDQENLTAEVLVNRFRATATPLSFELVCNLAASPSLRLPVMRLVQEATLSKSTQLNLSEVLLGGLLKIQSDSQENTINLQARSSKYLASDLLEFQFIEGVREQLLNFKLVPDVAYIFRLVSRFLKAKHITDFDFEVLLDYPESYGKFNINERDGSFALVAFEVLRRLGGRYKQFADPPIRSSIYALLVGIDKYDGGVRNLNGCENDVQEFYTLLKDRYGVKEKNIKLLLSEDAKRENIIKGFTDHLSQAGEGDTALFYYSGHGAQETASEAFWGMEPDHLNETLVCHDSRSLGGWDLADKELRYLIHGLTKESKPHIAVILDSCHSSSGTRDPLDNLEGIRLTEIHPEKRPIEKYCFYEDFKTRGIDPASYKFPQGQHILLSACRDSELAKEISIDGKTRGTFSHYLRTTLSGQQESMSYRDLWARVRRRVEATVAAQTPQLEPIANANPNENFLGGEIIPHKGYVIYQEEEEWWLDAGAVHGITLPEGDSTTHLAIFSSSTESDDLNDLTKKITVARVTKVLPDKSQIAVEDELTTVAEDDGDQAQYKAVITKL